MFLPRNNDNIDCEYANGVELPFKQHMRDSVSLSEREELRERVRKTIYCLLASRCVDFLRAGTGC